MVGIMSEQEKIWELYKNILPVLLSKYITNTRNTPEEAARDSLRIAEFSCGLYNQKYHDKD